MARTARIVIPDTPHHVCQRANRDDNIFNEKADFETYADLLREQTQRFGVAIWCYALLPNQIHLIAVPRDTDGLARAIGETNRRYTLYVNGKDNLRGHLFQNRFFSYPMDSAALLTAAQMIERLPVMARIAPSPEAYLWSSCRTHCKGREDKIMTAAVLPAMTDDWEAFISRWPHPLDLESIQTHLQTGRPRGSDTFLNAVEQMTGRTVRPQKRGRKPKAMAA